MKIIVIMFITIFFVACNKSEEKKDIKITKTEKTVEKIEKVKEFDLKKNCTMCHDLPKFSELEKSYIEKHLLNHRKLRRIRLEDKDFSLLVKKLKDMGK